MLAKIIAAIINAIFEALGKKAEEITEEKRTEQNMLLYRDESNLKNQKARMSDEEITNATIRRNARLRTRFPK